MGPSAPCLTFVTFCVAYFWNEMEYFLRAVSGCETLAPPTPICILSTDMRVVMMPAFHSISGLTHSVSMWVRQSGKSDMKTRTVGRAGPVTFQRSAFILLRYVVGSQVVPGVSYEGRDRGIDSLGHTGSMPQKPSSRIPGMMGWEVTGSSLCFQVGQHPVSNESAVWL